MSQNQWPLKNMRYVKLVIFYSFLMKIYKITPFFKVYNIFPKSKKGIEKWTFLKMSNFGKPKKVSKNSVFSRCD